jgi:cell wall assembly regulator SMI1
MSTIWKRLESWLAEQAPELLEDLNPGCSVEELENLERQIGSTLPDSFRLFYLGHDGQMSCEPFGLFMGLTFLSIQNVTHYQQTWAGLVDMNEEMASSMSSRPDGYIRPLYANPKWIPFTHDEAGNHIGIDLDPDTLGTWGQVIVFGRDEDIKQVISTSFDSFLERLLQELEGGNFLVEDGEVRFHHYPDGFPESVEDVHANDIFKRFWNFVE